MTKDQRRLARLLKKQNEAIDRAKEQGYQYGQSLEKDSKAIEFTYNPNTRQLHERMKEVYVTWNYNKRLADGTLKLLTDPSATRECIKSDVLGVGAALPSIDQQIDFFRFYINSTKGIVTTNGRPSLDTCLSSAEFFFAGFTAATGTDTPEEGRAKIYKWLKVVACEEEKLIENVHKPKHLFGKLQLDAVMKGLWIRSDYCPIHERNRVQASFIVPTYCWTGARIAAFFTGTGLRYRDIELVRKRFANGEVKFIYNVDQRWVKNNRDPENIVYSIASEEDKRLKYNECAFLLPMAFADKALFGYDSYDDLMEQEIPDGCDFVPLRWNSEVEDLPILRHVKKDGTVTSQPMKLATFRRIFDGAVVNEGYKCVGGMHKVRRNLGKKLDERYTASVRSQHITQRDPSVYGRSYMAHTSSANGKRAFLDEPANHEAIDYFQGIEKFREEGLPLRPSTELELAVRRDPEVMNLEREIEQCGKDTVRAEMLKRQKKNLQNRLVRERFREEQQNWIREQRDQRILTRGKLPLAEHQREQHVLISILPERQAMAQLMQADGDLTSSQMRLAVNSLHSLCTRDLEVIYRPGEEPTETGECPVCGLPMTDISKRSRSAHIHDCRRKQVANERCVLQSQVRYCYDCFAWITAIDGQWSEHCGYHLQSLKPTSCDRLTYMNTTIKEFRCGGCAGPETCDELRLKCYTPRDFWPHVQHEHIDNIRSWPTTCFYFGCENSCSDQSSLECHLRDCHYRSRRKITKPYERGIQKRKRKEMSEVDDEEWSSNDTSPLLDTNPVLDFESQNSGISSSLSSCNVGIAPPSQDIALGIPENGYPHSLEADTRDSDMSPTPCVDFDMSLLDPRLIVHEETFGGDAQIDSLKAEIISTQREVSPRETVSRLASVAEEATQQTNRNARDTKTASIHNLGQIDLESNNSDHVEILRAECAGWYLAKWTNWDDEDNEWRKPQDLPSELVEEYHRNHERNYFGVVVGKRRRGALVEYRMRWNHLRPRQHSWLSPDSIEAKLIQNFEDEAAAKKSQPRRKKKKTAKY